jgi:hypothetical protein
MTGWRMTPKAGIGFQGQAPFQECLERSLRVLTDAWRSRGSNEVVMSARIFSPAKTAMQSGTAKTGYWVLEFDPEQRKKIDPLMGYTTSGDMRSQIRLTFDTREEAVAYAEKEGLAYRVEEPKEPKRRQISYAENFRYDRRTPWTH